MPAAFNNFFCLFSLYTQTCTGTYMQEIFLKQKSGRKWNELKLSSAASYKCVPWTRKEGPGGWCTTTQSWMYCTYYKRYTHGTHTKVYEKNTENFVCAMPCRTRVFYYNIFLYERELLQFHRIHTSCCCFCFTKTFFFRRKFFFI